MESTGVIRVFAVATFLTVFALPGARCLARQEDTERPCTVEGLTYDHGASWTSQGGCQECRCNRGLTFCERVSCGDLGQCGVAFTPPDACCPVCLGCVTPSGKKVSLNETWMEDDCTTCVCRDGQTKCQASFCRTPCLHPRKVPGECCPVCDDDCHLECLYGRATDAAGRELCECRKLPDEDYRDLRVTIKTRLISPDEEEVDDNYLTTNENEALACPKIPCKKTCQHGFQTDGRGCPICKCQRCQSIQPCRKKCPLGLIHDARGCPTCRCRTSAVGSPVTPSVAWSPSNGPTTTSLSSGDGKCFSAATNATYSYGERWLVDDCTQCLCHPGGPTCTEMACPVPCHHPVFVPGQCCPLCGVDGGLPSVRHQHEDDHREDSGLPETEDSTLKTVVVICVSVVVVLVFIVAVLGAFVARQCQKIQLHEESMAAAVKLTAVNRLRPKSTNLDYQYTLYMQRYREATPGGLERTSESHDNDEGGSSQCSNSPLLIKNGQ